MGKLFSSCVLIGGATALLAMSTSTVAQADEMPVFKPASAWVMDDQEDACALRRTFAAGESTLTAKFESNTIGNNINITLASRDLETKEAQVIYQFLPDEEWREPQSPKVGAFGGELESVSFFASLRASIGDWQPGATMWPVAERQQREAAITGLQVAGAFEQQVLLLTGPMDEAMDAMRACVDDLYVSWGFDPRINDTVAVLPKPANPDRWNNRVMGASVPRAGSRGGLSMRFVFLVGVDGRTAQCRAPNAQADPKFAEAYCNAFERHARFDPAQDASGNEVQSISTQLVTLGAIN